ncbi:MAG TPA: VOC family protein [candidate division Zixibacteria bacterium]|nr:VOC family protein [candidate division Zixibacteria bacterium]
MLRNVPMAARIAASDIGRARAWYAEKLGLEPEHEEMGGISLWYRTGDTWFLLYQTDAAGTARNTVGGWEVKDLPAVMAELRSRGVVFEEYDWGELKTVDGMMTIGNHRVAWFTDSEGNILELTENVGA